MVNVVCALILEDSKVLVVKRPAHKSEGLKWEFPGGKVEAGESEAAALAREISEELAIDVLPVESIVSVFSSNPTPIKLIAWSCQWMGGNIELNEHLAIDWITAGQLRDTDLSHADRLLIPEIESYMANLKKGE